MEINKDQTNEKKRRLFIQSLLQQGSQHYHSHLAKTQRQAEEWECFIVGKREGFRRALIGGWWHRDPVGRLTRSRVFYMIHGGTYLAFSGWF